MSESATIIDLKVADAGYTKDLYSSIDCYVGYKFVRFEVDGVVKPCCGYPYSVGNFLEEDWQRIWHSAAMAEFRKKTAQMSVGKWHITAPEWSFCQNCSHRTLNVEADEVLKRPLLDDNKATMPVTKTTASRDGFFRRLMDSCRSLFS